jgi:hypothetical protein
MGACASQAEDDGADDGYCEMDDEAMLDAAEKAAEVRRPTLRDSRFAAVKNLPSLMTGAQTGGRCAHGNGEGRRPRDQRTSGGGHPPRPSGFGCALDAKNGPVFRDRQCATVAFTMIGGQAVYELFKEVLQRPRIKPVFDRAHPDAHLLQKPVICPAPLCFGVR